MTTFMDREDFYCKIGDLIREETGLQGMAEKIRKASDAEFITELRRTLGWAQRQDLLENISNVYASELRDYADALLSAEIIQINAQIDRLLKSWQNKTQVEVQE